MKGENFHIKPYMIILMHTKQVQWIKWLTLENIHWFNANVWNRNRVE